MGQIDLTGTFGHEAQGTQTSEPWVLIVEDDIEVMKVTVELLEEIGDYHHITCAPNGKAGIAAIYEHRPDIIITDVNMPVMDGISMLKEIRADAALKNLPVVVTSGMSWQDLAMQAGANAYLSKPCDPEQMIDVVNRLLAQEQRRRAALSPAAVPGGIALP